MWRDANGERQEATEYQSIVLFGRISEAAQQYAVKGRAVYVEGRLRTRDFTDGDGNCRRCVYRNVDMRLQRAGNGEVGGRRLSRPASLAEATRHAKRGSGMSCRLAARPVRSQQAY